MKHALGAFSFECIFIISCNVAHKTGRIASTVPLRVQIKNHLEKIGSRLEISVTQLS